MCLEIIAVWVEPYRDLGFCRVLKTSVTARSGDTPTLNAWFIVHWVYPEFVDIRPSPVQQRTIGILQGSYQTAYLGVEFIISENEKACPCQALGDCHADLMSLNTSCRGCKRWSVIPSSWLCGDCYATCEELAARSYV